mgnify:CR=1 FL=1
MFVRCELADGTVGWGEGVPRSYVTGETAAQALRLVAWNHRYIELFDYPEGQVYVGRPVAEHVEDDLDRLHARKLDRLQRLLDLLHADPVKTQLSRCDEIVRRAKAIDGNTADPA